MYRRNGGMPLRSSHFWRGYAGVNAGVESAKLFRILIERLGGGSRRRGSKPGGWLTEQTGSIPDTAQESRRGLKTAHAMEREQCDGRETAVCV